MKTESLQNLLKLKYGNQEQYTKEQLANIQSIFIQRFDITGEFIDVYPEELLSFPNLEVLTIEGCIIDEDFVEVLKNISNLTSINFIQCEFQGDYHTLFEKPTLKDYCFDGTPVSLSLMNKGMFDTIILSNIEILEEVEFFVNKLDIRKATIQNWGFLKSKIGSLIVTESQLKDLDHYSGPMMVMDDIDPETLVKEVNV